MLYVSRMNDVTTKNKAGGAAASKMPRKWSHITVHATPDFHHEYKLFALTHGLTMQQLMMESFELFKQHIKGRGRPSAR